MRADEFLTVLWGGRPAGFIELWTKHTKKSNYLQSPAGANIIAGLNAPDVYTGTCLSFKRFDARQRAKATQRIAIAGLWLDLDVNGGPDNKTGAAPTKTDALRLARELHEPTMTVDSGYGIHAWWLLDEPWRFDSIAEQQAAAVASAQWYQLHRRQAQQHGWSIDHTHDLARLLRVPGTVNAKGSSRPPVDVLAADGPRYPQTVLLEHAAAAGPVDLHAASRPGQRAQVLARADAQPPDAKLEALRFNSPEFDAALDHHGHPDWSQSEWDLSLASQAAAAGWTEQEIADLIVWDRNRHGVNVHKGQRVQYVRRTVAIATDRAQRAGAGETLERLARVPA